MIPVPNPAKAQQQACEHFRLVRARRERNNKASVGDAPGFDAVKNDGDLLTLIALCDFGLVTMLVVTSKPNLASNVHLLVCDFAIDDDVESYRLGCGEFLFKIAIEFLFVVVLGEGEDQQAEKELTCHCWPTSRSCDESVVRFSTIPVITDAHNCRPTFLCSPAPPRLG